MRLESEGNLLVSKYLNGMLCNSFNIRNNKISKNRRKNCYWGGDLNNISASFLSPSPPSPPFLKPLPTAYLLYSFS